MEAYKGGLYSLHSPQIHAVYNHRCYFRVLYPVSHDSSVGKLTVCPPCGPGHDSSVGLINSHLPRLKELGTRY